MAPNVRSMNGRVPVPRVQAVSTACPALDPRAIIAQVLWTTGRVTAPFHVGTLACMRMDAALPEWAMWKVHPDLEPWRIATPQQLLAGITQRLQQQREELNL